MITILKQVEREIRRTAILEPNGWVHVTAPSQLEIRSLQQEYNVPLDVIQDILDPDEQSRSEKDDGYHLIIVRVPVGAHPGADASPEPPNEDIPYVTMPMGILLLPEVVITICARESELFRDLLENRVKNLSLGNRPGFVLKVLQRAAFLFLRYLKDLNRRTTALERELQRSVKNNELIRLLNLEKSLVYFTTSLKSNELLVEKLQKALFVRLDEAGTDLLEDVLIESRQAIEMANIYSNILSGMMDAFASVISNNLNVVMKRLTSISLILMIPTLVASLYGMNVSLPFQGAWWAFLGVVGVSAGLSVMSVFAFLGKRFLLR
ncbi:MAG: magnesium transporter CorA family protein [Spirochaetales bacterium]|nr:magnesium transporter CorA family protein [Spirochaetales bacterium]